MADGMYRARDVEFDLKNTSVDPAIKMVLCKIAEQSHVNMKGLAELASMFDQITGLVNGMMTIAGNMKERTDQMARAMNDIPEDPSVN
jgi:hypothetical protein